LSTAESGPVRAHSSAAPPLAGRPAVSADQVWDQLERAPDPCHDDEVVERTIEQDVVLLRGVTTPSMLESSLSGLFSSRPSATSGNMRAPAVVSTG
jgi:hypothetical protein